MSNRKKGAGGKLSRSEIVQARLNPKVKFIAEIVSRKERQTLSSLIESSLELFLTTYKFNVRVDQSYKKLTANEVMNEIWSSDEATKFIKYVEMFPEDLSPQECKLWQFILDTKYFWSHFQVKVITPKGKFIKYRWEAYQEYFDGIVIENLQEFWNLIQTDEQRSKVKIPNQMGKKIEVPSGEEAESIENYDTDHPIVNDLQVERDRWSIWKQNITNLIKQEFETIETPEGPKTNIKIIYPTPEEQMEMVERIYQEQKKCRSNS